MGLHWRFRGDRDIVLIVRNLHARARGWGRGERELFFNGYSISVWDDGRLLEKDGGRGCTTT